MAVCDAVHLFQEPPPEPRTTAKGHGLHGKTAPFAPLRQQTDVLTEAVVRGNGLQFVHQPLETAFLPIACFHVVAGTVQGKDVDIESEDAGDSLVFEQRCACITHLGEVHRIVFRRVR